MFGVPLAINEAFAPPRLRAPWLHPPSSKAGSDAGGSLAQ
jgi:hypothetical protein